MCTIFPEEVPILYRNSPEVIQFPLGWNDENGTLADEEQLNRRTTFESNHMPKAANRICAGATLRNANITAGDQTWENSWRIRGESLVSCCWPPRRPAHASRGN
jgi:hypothetical protein